MFFTDPEKSSTASKFAQYSGCTICTCSCPYTAIYVMASAIPVLCLIVIGLIVLLYKVNKKTRAEEDKIEITKTDSSSKYNRQLSSETNEVSFTKENSKDDSRFKLARQESNMSILDYPNNQDMFKKKREEHTSTNTLNRIMLNQPKHMHKDQIEAICKAVLQKNQKRNECTSLSNLDRIVNEAKAKEADDHVTTEKSASSGILDAIDSCEVTPSSLSVKDVINNFEVLPSPLSPRKCLKPDDNKPKTIKKNDVKPEGASSLPFRLPVANTTTMVDMITEDDTYNNPAQGKRPVSSNKSEDEHINDIYVDLPNNGPICFDSDDDERVDDVYDNPLNNRPVQNASDDHVDEIYDDPTNNRPVNAAAIIKEEIHDDVQFKRFADKISVPKQKVKDVETKDVYDFPSLFSRGIAVANDDNSGYALTLTASKEPCFDSNYVNARSFNL